jgi:hypothetical protein
MNFNEAVKYWVRGFNAIERGLMDCIANNNIDDIIELTPVTEGNEVWSNDLQNMATVVKIDKDNNKAILNYNNEEVETNLDEISLEQESFYPMWDTMWTFEEGLDENWAMDNLELMAECGFRVYEYQPTGTLYFGIDGCGYDFYEAHWNKLYKARGLHWHTEK